MINRLNDLFDAVGREQPRRIVIAAAAEAGIVQLVRASLQRCLGEFVLVGDQDRIRELLAEQDIDYQTLEILHRPDPAAAAETAVQQVREGRADVIIKGELPTATFLRAVLDRQGGLRAGGLVSQATVLEKMDGQGLQLLTDCAMNIAPTLDEKKQIIENAVVLARKLGYERPRVALLSALESVNPALPDSVDAAILSKMADRGQIKHALVDGPFALDNAISVEAARQKGLEGPVAGNADIVLMPNLQVGNALHKALTYYARRQIAAAITGTRAPLVMTSRTDPVETKLLSLALAVYTA